MSQHPQADDSALVLAPGDADDPQALTAVDLEVEPPLSPWAEHFGLRGHEPDFFGSNHTWIAPREPPVDPVPAGRPSGITLYDVKGRLHAQDYDDLFLSERLQVSRFKGLRTREAQVLSQVDAHELPDESPWFANKHQHRMIEVREGEHLAIFKKERWLNNNNPMKDTTDSVRGEAIPDGQGWSVDYKPLWKELSLCLELADRILKHSFKGPWMQALLTRPDLMHPWEQHADGKTRTVHQFFKRGYWYIPRGNTPQPGPYHGDLDDDPLTGFDSNVDMDRVEREAKEAKPEKEDKEKEPAVPFQRGKPAQPAVPSSSNPLFAPPGWMDDVDGCHRAMKEVSERVHWTFFDNKSDPRPEEVKKTELYHTSGLFWDTRFCVVSLNVEAIRPLLEESSSPVERILAINMVAITIIRGVMDAIRFWLKQNHQIQNPTFEQEGVVDLQSSFENAVFGGRIGFPLQHDAAEKPRKGNSLILTGSDFPTMGDFGVKWLPNSDKVAEYHTLDTPQTEVPFRTSWRSYPIPAIWSATLLRNDFWELQIEKLSNDALFFPKNFRAKERRLDGFGSHHFETRTYSAEFRSTYKQKDGMAQLNQLLISKRSETAAERPWYWDAYYRWQVSFFSMPITRWYFNRIHRWMLSTDDWDAFQIQEITRFWQARLPSFNGAPLGWFYSAVADLVAASLPLREMREVIMGEEKTWEGDPFDHIKGSNASNPVHLPQVRESLSQGYTKRREFELEARSVQARRDHFLRAWNKFDFYFHNRPHHFGMWVSIRATLRIILTDIENPNCAYWRFGLAPYSDDLVGTNWEHPETRREVRAGSQRNDGPEFQRIGSVYVRPPMLAQFAASVADARENLMEELPAHLQASHFEDRIDEPRDELGNTQESTSGVLPIGFSRRAQTERYWPEVEYIPIGKILNHVGPEDLWVIKEEGDELAVYDISEACQRTNMAIEDIDKMVVQTEYGFHVKPGIEWNIPEDLAKKMGYVLRWMHEEVVAENDGRDGRPLWINIGLNVFNITNFPFFGNEDLENALRSIPGGNPTPAILANKNLRSQFSAIIEALMPWRCGQLREIRTPATSELLFTVDDVAWYEFTGTGMYTIINGGVYDVTEYAENHPGGSTILANYGGRDASGAFQQHHSGKWDSILDSYRHIRIGSIVASRPSSQPLESNEFQYDSHVYQLPPIPALLDKFGGKEIDEVMRGESKEQRESEDSVYATWRRGDLCVKLTRPKYCVARREVEKPLRNIDARELRACDGEEEDEWYNEGWVAIGEDVYNLTTVIQHGPRNLADTIRHYLGGQVTNTQVADWIRSRYPFRVVAKLTDSHVFDDMEGLRSGMLNDGSPVLRKPKWNDSASVLDEAFPEVPHVPRDTQGRGKDKDTQVPPSRGRTPHRSLKRTRTPSPAHASKLRVLTGGHTKRLFDGETLRLAHDVRGMGVVDPLATPGASLPHIKRNHWKLGHMLEICDGEEAEMRRMREEGQRMGVEAGRGDVAMMG